MRVSLGILLLALCSPAFAKCKLSDVVVVDIRSKFSKICEYPTCDKILDGVVTVNNKCEDSVGFMVQLKSLDANGKAISVDEIWPASIRNIPPGEYDFSLKNRLPYSDQIDKIQVRVIDVKKW